MGNSDLGALEKAELKNRERLDRVSLGNDFPIRGRNRGGPGACGSGGGEERGLGVTGLVQGKLVGSQAEPELFGGLLTRTMPWQHFLEMSFELRLSLYPTVLPT